MYSICSCRSVTGCKNVKYFYIQPKPNISCMKQIYLSVLGILTFAGAAAQQNINFEPGGNGANYSWNVFENDINPPLEFVANPSASGINTSSNVAKFTSLATGNPWAGTETVHGNMGSFTLDMAHSQIKIMVYKSVMSDVGIKLVQADGSALPEIKVPNTVINQWQELTFNFSSQVGTTFDQIVIFPDFSTFPRTYGTVSYFDNITFGTPETMPLVPQVAAPDPTLPQAQVISMFSGVYNNVPVDTWQTSWSQASVQDVQIQGNATKKYVNLNFVGVETVAQQINATNMTHFNLNVWSSDFTQFRIKLVDFGANGVYDGPGNGDDKEHELTYTAPQQGNWITYHIPLSAFTGLTTRGHIAQLIFASNGTSTVYIDNVYFSNETQQVAMPMVAAPTPAYPQAQVISMFSDTYNNVPVDTWHTSWSSAVLEDMTIQGNATKKYSALSFVGIETVAQQINATQMQHFNVDVWSGDYSIFKIKLVDFGANGVYDGPGMGDDKEHEIIFNNPVQGLWVTHHIPLSSFTGLTTRANIAQLIFASDNTSTVYVDNVYFSTDALGVIAPVKQSLALYPNPARDVLTVNGFEQGGSVAIYNVVGQRVASGNASQVNVASLPVGVYIAQVVSGGRTSSLKFIKQ